MDVLTEMLMRNGPLKLRMLISGNISRKRVDETFEVSQLKMRGNAQVALPSCAINDL